MLLKVVVFVNLAWRIVSIYEWSFQQKLRVPSAGDTYGTTPVGLVGRGFQTLITGYSANASRPGIYIHTTDDGYVSPTGHAVWTQQAILKPAAYEEGDQFGKYMVSYNQTIIVSSPMARRGLGYVYVFNGTLRHWSQVQRLQIEAPDSNNPGDQYGSYMSLHGDRLVIGAKGTLSNAGAAYVYIRPPGSILWSRQGKLVPRDSRPSDLFAESLAIHDDLVVASARNNETTSVTGAAYVFRSFSGQWSQQQKLVALDIYNYQNKIAESSLDRSYTYPRRFSPSVAINEDYVAVGITNDVPEKPNENSVYIFGGSSTDYALQQRLFWRNDSDTTQITSRTDVLMDHNNTLIVRASGPKTTSAYIFKTMSCTEPPCGWSLQQKLAPCAMTSNTVGSTSIEHLEGPTTSCTNLTNPSLQGGNLIFTNTVDDEQEIQILTKYNNQSCLLLWMSDHFLDGWDTAVLTVRAPDLTNDTFHPHCDQVDPFVVRYCPYQPEDEGVYIVKVFAAVEARFFWEISWKVTIENTGEEYRGDFSSKMHFNYNATSNDFSFVSGENLIDIYDTERCFRCTTISVTSWTDLQESANSVFWPLDVIGAPYYISDYQGRNLYATGKVCAGVNFYECYQSLVNGIYILRLGGGLFGRETGFPYLNSNWTGCGASGTQTEQFVFAIAEGECIPLQTFNYTTRCARPPPIDSNQFSSTRAPTFGGTIAPTQSTFGDPYKKFQMYDIDISGMDNIADDTTTTFGTANTATAQTNAEMTDGAARQLGDRKEEEHSHDQEFHDLRSKITFKDPNDFTRPIVDEDPVIANSVNGQAVYNNEDKDQNSKYKGRKLNHIFMGKLY